MYGVLRSVSGICKLVVFGVNSFGKPSHSSYRLDWRISCHCNDQQHFPAFSSGPLCLKLINIGWFCTFVRGCPYASFYPWTTIIYDYSISGENVEGNNSTATYRQLCSLASLFTWLSPSWMHKLRPYLSATQRPQRRHEISGQVLPVLVESTSVVD